MHLPDQLFVRVPGESGWMLLPALHPSANFPSKSQAEKMGSDGQIPRSRAHYLGTEGKDRRGVTQNQAGSGKKGLFPFAD